MMPISSWWRRLGAAVILLGAASPVLAVLSASNGIYEVRVSDVSDGFSTGSWNAFTGAGHSTGPFNDILYDEAGSGAFVQQDTNFSTLRIYGQAGGSTDYAFGANGDGLAMDLDAFVISEGASPFGANGVRTTWSLPGESLEIVQDVVISGSTVSDSAIYHTIEVRNTGGASTSIGWRNLYDWQIDDPTDPGNFDDGPGNGIELSGGASVVPMTTTEFSHTPSADELARIRFLPGSAPYEVLLALGFDPGFIPALPVTLPDEYAYVSWPIAAFTNFDYVPTGETAGVDDPATPDDSAGAVWYGRDAAAAVDIGAGESARFTQVVFAVDANPTMGAPAPEPAAALLSLLGPAALGSAVTRRRAR